MHHGVVLATQNGTVIHVLNALGFFLSSYGNMIYSSGGALNIEAERYKSVRVGEKGPRSGGLRTY